MSSIVYGFNRQQADEILRILRERGYRGSTELPGLGLSPKRTFIVLLEGAIPALKKVSGVYRFSWGYAKVYKRDQDSDTQNSQDADNPISASATDGSRLTVFTDQSGTYVRKRVFNLTKSALQTDTPYLAEEDQFGDLYVSQGGGTSTSVRSRCVITYGHRSAAVQGPIAWREGDSALAYIPIIGWDGTAVRSVRLFPQMTGDIDDTFGNFSNNVGTVFSVKSGLSVTGYSDTWLKIKQNGKYRLIWTGVCSLVNANTSEANAQLRDAGHTHTISGGATGNNNAGATALTRKIATVQALVSTGLSWPPTSFATLEWFYGAYPPFSAYTIITPLERTDSTGDLSINLQLNQSVAESTDMRIKHEYAHVTVEQVSDS